MSWIKSLEIDGEWTLFLDRDGVINVRLIDAYVRHWGEWEWLPGVKKAIAVFSQIFARIIVVTNQRGIERGLMTEDDLAKIHQQMRQEVEEAGGKIDAVFHCPIGDPNAPCRKPNPGMLFEAAARYPDLRWKKSIMVGDAPSDMQMAHIVGIYSVFIGELPEELEGKVNAQYPGLREMAAALQA